MDSWDGMIQIYEAAVLVIVYFLYVGIMFFNEQLMLKLVDLEEAISKWLVGFSLRVANFSGQNSFQLFSVLVIFSEFH